MGDGLLPCLFGFYVTYYIIAVLWEFQQESCAIGGPGRNRLLGQGVKKKLPENLQAMGSGVTGNFGGFILNLVVRPPGD